MNHRSPGTLWTLIGVTFFLVFGWEIGLVLVTAGIVLSPLIALGLVLWYECGNRRRLHRRGATQRRDSIGRR